MGRVDHRRGQDLAEGHHHGGVQLQGLEAGYGLRVAHGGWRADLKAQALGEGLHRRGLERLATPARRGRLGVDGRDLETRRDQYGQGGHGELRRAEKGDAHGGV